MNVPTGVGGLAADLRSGALTASELTDRSLRLIGANNEKLGAFAMVDAAAARAAAATADAELSAGHDRGPLHGIPVGIKDIIDVAGWPTGLGSAHADMTVSPEDADCVRRLRAAGAVIIGKTTTHEFAYGPTGDRSITGPARNPVNTARMAGGSSAGSAVAVAAGLVPVAIGTDTGGSVRIPAALCGIAGFKPAHGALSTQGAFPLAPTLDHVGVLAGTAHDCALAYGVLAGAVTLGEQREPPFTTGWVQADRGGPYDDDVEAAAREALRGHLLTEVAVPGIDRIRAAFRDIQGSEAYAVHAERIARRPDLFDPEVLDRLRVAGEIRGWHYVRGQEVRRRAQQEVSELLSRFDLLAMPTVGITAPLLGQREVTVGGAIRHVRDVLLAGTSPWNLIGLPALTVPAGAVRGLPVGVQLVAARGRESDLFSAATHLGPRIQRVRTNEVAEGPYV